MRESRKEESKLRAKLRRANPTPAARASKKASQMKYLHGWDLVSRSDGGESIGHAHSRQSGGDESKHFHCILSISFLFQQIDVKDVMCGWGVVDYYFLVTEASKADLFLWHGFSWMTQSLTSVGNMLGLGTFAAIY